jgi:hypothetical protein
MPDLSKLKAFTEMLAEDISDALNHDLEPQQIVLALLLYSCTVAIADAKISAEDFLNYAIATWNDRAEALDNDPYFLAVYDEGEGPNN